MIEQSNQYVILDTNRKKYFKSTGKHFRSSEKNFKSTLIKKK